MISVLFSKKIKKKTKFLQSYFHQPVYHVINVAFVYFIVVHLISEKYFIYQYITKNVIGVKKIVTQSRYVNTKNLCPLTEA